MSSRSVSAFALAIALMLCGCDQPDSQSEPVRPVRAIRVGDLKAIEGREFPGRARAKGEVDLSFQVSGPLVSIPVDVGTEVKKGDIIATIDPRDFQATLESNQGSLERAKANLLAMQRGARPEEIEQLKFAVEQAEASYKQAVAEHERNSKFVVSGAVSKSEFDISQARAERTSAQVKSAKEALNIGQKGARPEDLDAKKAEIRALEAAVASAKNQLEYTVLKAPFDGQVAARYVDNFQTVQAKQPIARILDLSKIEITVQVPESLISLAPQVKAVVCRFDALQDREFAGVVTKIGSEASQTTRTFPVTVLIEQPGDVRILPGMAATVRNRPESGKEDSSAKPQMIVPSSALFTAESGQETYVWIVGSGQKVTRRKVTTGNLTPVGVTVLDGVQAGELVVTSGANSLRDGVEVMVPEEAR